MSSLPVLTTPDPALFSRERQAAFLAALAGTGNVRSASARAGVSHQTAYRTRLASPGFRRAWDAALLAARAQAEEVLACRALDGWEEDVLYHGEVVATRRRYSDRLLLAHLARLDRLCGDAEVAGFADAFDLALERYAAGEDRPALKPEKLAKAAARAAERCVPAEAGTSGGRTPGREAPAFAGEREGANFLSGERSRRSTRKAKAVENPCPDCGGRCLGPADKLTRKDFQWPGNRLVRMSEARPWHARHPGQFPCGDPDGEIEAAQLAAFEAGVEQWWRVIPAPPGGDPEAWHYLDPDEE